MTRTTSGSVRLVMVTAPGEKQAASIGQALVAERLAACVNIVGPVRSIYRWKEAVEDDTEYLMLIKTRARLVAKLERRVRELHSYEVPEVIALPVVGGSDAYLEWVLESTALRSDRKG